jgi:hypothetical protein
VIHLINAASSCPQRRVACVPQVLYEQFRYFFNLYFLLVALSQFIPALQVPRISPSSAQRAMCALYPERGRARESE